MFSGEGLRHVADQLDDLMGSFAPECVNGDGARELVRVFDHIVRLGTAGRTLSLARVEETNAHCADGAKNAATWFANETGTSVADAVGELETGRAIEKLDDTREVFVSAGCHLTKLMRWPEVLP